MTRHEFGIGFRKSISPPWHRGLRFSLLFGGAPSPPTANQASSHDVDRSAPMAETMPVYDGFRRCARRVSLEMWLHHFKTF